MRMRIIEYICFNKRVNIFFLLILAMICHSCSNIVFQPSRKAFLDPKTIGVEYKNVYFKSVDGTMLHGWFFPARSDADVQGTVIQFHGNAENISTHFASLVWMTRYGYNLFTFDYRGYGQSEGSPTHAGVNNDALAALNYAITLNQKMKGQNENLKLIVYGQSIGGNILVRAMDDLENKTEIDAIILESAFSSYRKISKEKLSLTCITWPFQPLVYIMMSDDYSSRKSIKRLPLVPLLVIHGDNDRIIPIHHGKKIYDLANEPKQFWRIKGGRHINAMYINGGVYRGKLIDFLSKLSKFSKL